MSEKKRILFVCQGNIIRSPLAEHLFRQQVEERGIADQFEIDSAGTSAWHAGEPPDARMRQVAASHGLVYSGQARQVRREDLEYYDLIIAMDHENFRDLLRLVSHPGERRKIHLLREFDPDSEPDAPVPDPYYGGQDGFENVFRIVRKAAQALLVSLGSDE